VQHLWIRRAPVESRWLPTPRARLVWRGFVGSTLCLFGGILTVPVPATSRVIELALVAGLRGSATGRAFGILLVVIGLTLTATAWLALLDEVRERAVIYDLPMRLSLVRWATIAWSLPLLVAPPLFSRDGWSYAAQGELTHLGLSPYVWGPSVLQGPIVEAVDPMWLNTVSPYGPLPLMWGSFAATFTDSPWLLVIAHRVFTLGGLALLAYALPKLASWARRDPAYVSALVLASPLMLAHGVAGLHNDLMMAGLMAVALVVTVERSWVLGAVLAGLAAAVKLPGGLVGVGVALASLSALVSWQARLWRLVLVAAVAVATLVGTGAAVGVGTGWVHALGVPGQVRTPLSLSTQIGALLQLLFDAAGGHTLADGSVAATRAVGSVVALGLAAWIALRAPTGSPASATRTTAFVMLGTLALSPVVQHWYALWFLPLLATCRLSHRWQGILVSTSLVLGLSASLDGTLATYGYLGVALVTALVLSLGTFLVVRERRAHADRGQPTPASVPSVPSVPPLPSVSTVTPTPAAATST
jgi:hypothetical protein